MLPILKKLFGQNKKNRDNLFKVWKSISILSDKMEKKNKLILEKEYSFLLSKKNEVYISLNDFLCLMETPNLSIKDIISKCKHASEIDGNVSIVEMYSVIEDKHIVLCPDVKNCEKHKYYDGTKIRISTIKRV